MSSDEEISLPPRPRRPVYRTLESARGICAVMVVLYHAQAIGLAGGGVLVANSFLFVDFFFVLSGFVIASSYYDRLDDSSNIVFFMKLRFWRIYPLHAFMLIIFVLFELAFLFMGQADRKPFTGVYSPAILGETIVLLQTFFASGTGWNGPSWSIAVEFWTYLLFAIVVTYARRPSVIVFSLIPIVSAIYIWFLTDRYISVVLEGAFARCLYGFSMGVLLFLVRTRVSERLYHHGAMATFEIPVFIACIAFVYLAGAGPYSMLTPLVFTIFIFVVSFEKGPVSSVLLLRPLLFVGKLSFSIYMIHEFILLRFENVIVLISKRLPAYKNLVSHVDGHWHIVASSLTRGVMLATFAVVVMIAANLTYQYVELPFYHRARRRSVF